MIVTREEGARPIKAWLGLREVEESEGFYTDLSGRIRSAVGGEKVIDIEDAAMRQTRNIAKLPFIAPQGVALMPDAHLGKGATVGSVVPTTNAIIPSAVGVDLGCGMNAVRLSLKAHQLPDSLVKIRHQIERDVPLGAGGCHEEGVGKWANPAAMWDGIPESVRTVFNGDRWKTTLKAATQLGTLGSGNHFIELCVDENDDVWVMLHSG